MRAEPRRNEGKTSWVGTILVAAVGLAGLVPPLGTALSDLSYDLFFAARPDLPISEVALVYMDDASHERLGQPTTARWSRSVHAALLGRMAAASARAVVFDILFESSSGKEDRELLEAVATATNRGTRVFFSGVIVPEDLRGFGTLQRVIPPFANAVWPGALEPTLRMDELVPWGVATIGEAHPRQHFRPPVREPTLAWRVAELTGAAALPERDSIRWLNFYGPPGHLPAFSYYRALDRSAIPDEAFSNKVVFVGANVGLGFAGGTGTDHHESPYGLRRSGKFPGVDLQATTYLNLVRGDWLRRINPWLEFGLVVFFGLGLVTILAHSRLSRVVLVALTISVGTAAAAFALAWLGRWWFSWLTLSGVQVGVAALWAVSIRLRSMEASSSSVSRRSDPPAVAGLEPAEAEAPAVESGLARAAELAVPAGVVQLNGGDRVAGRRPTVLVAPDPGHLLPRVPDHDLLRCVGTGGYGEIWLARNAIGIFHAVKIIRRDRFSDPTPFEREFRGLQRFMPISRSSPGLVHILHVGRQIDGGFIYYVMEAGDDEVRGRDIEPASYQPRTLASWIRQRGALRAAECLDLACALSEALGQLHAQRLVHRDIKPANIIFVDGKPKLADVGLVTETGAHRDVSFVGTEGYIPPEGPGRPDADVFALGILLYESLTGQPRESFPELPDSVLERADARQVLALNNLILRCCALDPRERFPSGTELCAALRQMAATFPVG